MANAIHYVVEKLEDGTWKGFGPIKNDMESAAPGRYMFSRKKYFRSRTSKQNRFYQGNFIASQIDCFKEFWGESFEHDEVHDWNKSMFWAEEVVDEDTGEVFKKPASSTDNSTVEWETKLETCRQWFRQKFSWELPYPEQQTKAKLT